ncbi:MAG: hypothetical protein LQ346_000281 [Caloplaca aetnensis]|nr:MAG: hypothetical protein LQ346_000281 [Caloplaca aetnensis]
MPVSHVGLTVSHLPTSCSFFLAALAPLNYRYIGQFDGQIGFGINEPEFFISQETASVKAGAAHVAFNAPSRNSVEAFFVAALKAGGRIHGEPAERDPTTAYYSAAILDLDGNSIEVMHRPKEPTASRSEHGSEASHVLSWQKEVARSAVGQDAQPPRPECQTVVTNILKPTIMVANASTESNPGSDANSKAFIGTLLGAAAGAAVAYAMTKGEEGGKATAGNIACQMVEAARSHLTPSVGGSQGSYPQSSVSHVSRRGLQTLEYTHSQPSASRSVASYQSSSSHKPTNRLTITAPPPPQVSTLINTFVPPSEVPRYRRPSLSRSQTDGAIPSVMHSTTPSHLSSRPKTSRTSSAARTITLADQTPSKQSSVVTEIRHPRDVPLPASKTTSITSRVEADLRRMVLDPRKDGEPCTAPESIAPSDSISQAASKRSRGSRKSNRHSSRAGSHRREEERSQFSEETIKAGTNKTGTRRASIMSLPTKPSSKASVHRSVVSFLPGM